MDAGRGKRRQVLPLRPLLYGLLSGLRRSLLSFPSCVVRLCTGRRDRVRGASWRDQNNPRRSFSNRCAVGGDFDAHARSDPILSRVPDPRTNRLILTDPRIDSHILVGCLSSHSYENMVPTMEEGGQENLSSLDFNSTSTKRLTAGGNRASPWSPVN